MNSQVAPAKIPHIKRAPLTNLVQAKVDDALIVDFDSHVARQRKSRGEVIRELMQRWISEQDQARKTA